MWGTEELISTAKYKRRKTKIQAQPCSGRMRLFISPRLDAAEVQNHSALAGGSVCAGGVEGPSLPSLSGLMQWMDEG